MEQDKEREAFEASYVPSHSATDDLAMASAFSAGYRASLAAASPAAPAALTLADAVAHIERKAEDYKERFGYSDMGALSFGSQVKMDHYTSLTELADELRELAAQPAEPAPRPDGCDFDVWKYGEHVGDFEISKAVANAICAGLSKITECKIDYFVWGGRIRIKAVPPPALTINKAFAARPEAETMAYYGGSKEPQPVSFDVESAPADRQDVALSEPSWIELINAAVPEWNKLLDARGMVMAELPKDRVECYMIACIERHSLYTPEVFDPLYSIVFQDGADKPDAPYLSSKDVFALRKKRDELREEFKHVTYEIIPVCSAKEKE